MKMFLEMRVGLFYGSDEELESIIGGHHQEFKCHITPCGKGVSYTSQEDKYNTICINRLPKPNKYGFNLSITVLNSDGNELDKIIKYFVERFNIRFDRAPREIIDEFTRKLLMYHCSKNQNPELN